MDKSLAASPCTRRLSDNEEKTLRAFFKDYGNRYLVAAFNFSIEMGLRKSELQRLDWKDIDLVRQWATVMQARKGRNPISQLKIRGFPLTLRTLAFLHSLKSASDMSVDGLVFKTTSDAIDCSRKGALKATGIADW